MPHEAVFSMSRRESIVGKKWLNMIRFPLQYT
jgi:hypothetical protein